MVHVQTQFVKMLMAALIVIVTLVMNLVPTIHSNVLILMNVTTQIQIHAELLKEIPLTV